MAAGPQGRTQLPVQPQLFLHCVPQLAGFPQQPCQPQPHQLQLQGLLLPGHRQGLQRRSGGLIRAGQQRPPTLGDLGGKPLLGGGQGVVLLHGQLLLPAAQLAGFLPPILQPQLLAPLLPAGQAGQGIPAAPLRLQLLQPRGTGIKQALQIQQLLLPLHGIDRQPLALHRRRQAVLKIQAPPLPLHQQGETLPGLLPGARLRKDALQGRLQLLLLRHGLGLG